MKNQHVEKILTIFKEIISKIVSVFLPRKCLSCSELLPDYLYNKINKSDICFKCANELYYITRPVCIQCCEKLSYDLMHGQICLDCMHNKWAFDVLIACVSYSEKSLRIAMQLKYKGIGCEYIARSIVKANPVIWENEKIDYIVPTPLHWKRLWKRGFNQTEVVGEVLAEITNIPMRLDILERVRYTQSQGRLGQKERVRNVAGAFRVPTDMIAEVKEKIIVLLDDVVTTSSTIQAAAKALKKAGAKKVIVMCWAKRLVKTVHGEELDKYSFDDQLSVMI